ncbi:MAG: hypothetical protein CL624_01125 [Arcobacter sp.]|nr:hypothetical protein [Arcobacter sp.]
MKRVTTAIVGLGLLVGSALSAQDNLLTTNEVLKNFYPIENSDTPDYLLDNNENSQTATVKALAESKINANTLIALYPAENNDTPDYIFNNNENNQTNTVKELAKTEINENVLCAIYPIENDDSANFARSC